MTKLTTDYHYIGIVSKLTEIIEQAERNVRRARAALAPAGGEKP